MVKDRSESTEVRILDAAKKVFLRSGLDGTTMQQIADEAGINKSLLHYYFRTKEKLFGTVLKYAFSYVLPQLKEIFSSDDTIFQKIEKIVSEYINLLKENPMIPAFILHEMNRNPEGLALIMKDAGINLEFIIKQLNESVIKGEIRPIDPKHLLVNVIALCVFPIIARPLVQRVLFDNKSEEYDQFLVERKKQVTEFIIASVKL